MRSIKFTGLVALCLANVAFAQKKNLPSDMVTNAKPKFVEEVKKVGNEIFIPYKRY